MPSPPSRRKRPWSQPLADLVSGAINPVLARQGFSESDLILYWDDIVGERLAARSRPIKIQWPPRPLAYHGASPQPATLVIRVEGSFAIELQHMADQVLARINAHLGWRCIGRLAFKQGPIEKIEASRPRRGKPAPESFAAAAAVVGTVNDEGLRDALTHLGARIVERAETRDTG